MSQNTAPTDREVVEQLQIALKSVMNWVSNWDPNFSYDPEWPETKDQASAALEEAEITLNRPPVSLRETWQQKCLDLGFEYWRAPDAHGVTCTPAQAVEFMQDALGVEVEIK